MTRFEPQIFDVEVTTEPQQLPKIVASFNPTLRLDKFE